MNEQFLIIFCTVPDEDTAIKLSQTLVEERLAACCNVLPGIRSVYTWKGNLCHDSELLLVIKSRAEIYQRLEQRISELHPYEVPEIIATEIKYGSPNYLKWMAENVDEAQ